MKNVTINTVGKFFRSYYNVYVLWYGFSFNYFVGEISTSTSNDYPVINFEHLQTLAFTT